MERTRVPAVRLGIEADPIPEHYARQPWLPSLHEPWAQIALPPPPPTEAEQQGRAAE